MKNFLISVLYALLLISCTTVKAPEVFEIHTPRQQEFLSGPYEMATIYAKGNAELSRPQPVIIESDKETLFISGQ